MVQYKCSHQAVVLTLMHAVMAGLIAASPLLRVIDISGTTSWSIQLMAAFTNLEKCALQHNSEELDLTPLQGLPKLQQVYLQDQFKQLHHLPSLTSLRCKDADITATSNCNFGSILQCLVLKNSLLQGIH